MSVERSPEWDDPIRQDAPARSTRRAASPPPTRKFADAPAWFADLAQREEKLQREQRELAFTQKAFHDAAGRRLAQLRKRAKLIRRRERWVIGLQFWVAVTLLLAIAVAAGVRIR